MRELQTDDLFLLVNVIEEFGVEDIVSALEKVDINDYTKDGNVNNNAFGTAIVKELGVLLLCNIGKCKVSLYKLLAELKGVKSSDIGKQKPVETVKDIKELLAKEDFKELFTVAFGSLK